MFASGFEKTAIISEKHLAKKVLLFLIRKGMDPNSAVALARGNHGLHLLAKPKAARNPKQVAALKRRIAALRSLPQISSQERGRPEGHKKMLQAFHSAIAKSHKDLGNV